MTDHRAQLAAGLAAHREGRWDAARRHYARAGQQDPQSADAWNLLGVLEHQSGRATEAVELFRRAVALAPERWEILSNLACALQDAGQLDEALAAHTRARDLAPERPMLWTNWGAALYQLGQADEAAKAWHRAIQLDPHCGEAYFNLGNLFRESGRLRESERCYERCLSSQPGHRPALANLTAQLLSEGQLDAVLTWTRRAAQVDPRWAEPWYRMGLAHKGLGQLAEAQAAYDQALTRDDQSVDAHYARALVQMHQGRWSEARRDFQWRWRRGGSPAWPTLAWPQWQGEPLTGRKLLVWGELGIEEEVLFSACLPAAAAQAGQLVVECDPRLVPLVRRSFPTATVNARAAVPTVYRSRGSDPIDFHAPSGDLPRWLMPEVAEPAASAKWPRELHSQRSVRGGWLVADDEQRRSVAERLAALGPGLKVALAWRDVKRPWGSSSFPAELAGWLPLLKTPGVHWINLEPRVSPRIFDQLWREQGIRVWEWFDQDLAQHLEPLAARMAAVDLVLSPPTLAAHLAGALGCPGWVLAPRGVDWHWGTGSRAAWYPTLEILREDAGGWPALCGQAVRRLGERTATLGLQQVMAAEPARPQPRPADDAVRRQVAEAQGWLESGQLERALEQLRKLAEAHPDAPEVQYAYGVQALKQKQTEPAIAALRRMAELEPGNPFCRFYLGVAYAELKRTHEAIDASRAALALKPDFPEAHLNLGAYLERLSRYDEALIHGLRAAELMPESASVFYNLANVHLHLGHLEEALAAYGRSLALDGSQPKAHWNRAIALLLLRRFAEGWEEWAYREAAGEVILDQFDEPTWEGSSLAGKTLLVHAEQGVGDEIMFASCIPDLVEEAGHVVMNCDPRLASLYQRSFPTVTVCPVRRPLKEPWRPPVPVDYTIAAGSVPRLLRPTIESFPRRAFLAADPGQVAWWRQRFEALGSGLKVGIAWRAGGKASEQRRRTAALEDWRSVLTLPGIDWMNLQYGDCTEDLAWVERELGITVHDFPEGDPLKDLDGFAARVAALDLVFSIGNTTIHMAGALGVPTWVVLPQVPGWRYMVEGDELLWYGSVQLFRQLRPDDWTGLFERMAQRLGQWVASQPAASRVHAHQTVAAVPVVAPPETIRSLFLDGLKHQRRGQLAEAEACYRQVVDRDPRHTDALQLLGVIAQSAGRLDEALDWMQRSLAINQQQGVVHYNLARAWEAKGQLDEARLSYQRALELEPNLAEAHLNLGVLWQSQGDDDEAKRCFRRAIEARPKLAEAHNNLGFVLLGQGHFQQAIQRFESALDLRPDYLDCRLNLARALAESGEAAAAINQLDRILAEHPEEEKCLALREQLMASRDARATIPPPHAAFASTTINSLAGR